MKNIQIDIKVSDEDFEMAEASGGDDLSELIAVKLRELLPSAQVKLLALEDEVVFDLSL